MGQLNEEIDRRAAEWAAKLAGGNLTPGEREDFDSWRDADIRHLGALARSQAILVRLDRLRAVGGEALRTAIAKLPSPPAEAPAAPSGASTSKISADSTVAISNETAPADLRGAPSPMMRPNWTRRRVMLTGSVAASVAAIGIVGVKLWADHARGDYSTQLGETRIVELSDGSVVTLNTNSKMSVTYTEKERNIRLSQGEAFFKVAKNKKRPFIVFAGDTQVRAVGTSFTVRLLPERPIQVLVQEGVVEVIRRDMPRAKPVRAIAETQTLVPLRAPIIVHTVPHPLLARKLAWQYGRIAFENETLSDAAQEFARYSNTKIQVDPAVGSLTITGLFASNDPIGFARVTASVLDLRVEVAPGEVRIVR